MTDRPGASGNPPAPERPPRSRARYKPVMAAAVVTSPLLALVLLNAAALAWGILDPSSTCWLKPQIEAGQRVLYPFEIHLLFFVATLQFWAPILLLMAVLFWYLEWIRVRELLGVAVLSAAVLYAVGVEFGWMVAIYHGRFLTACI